MTTLGYLDTALCPLQICGYLTVIDGVASGGRRQMRQPWTRIDNGGDGYGFGDMADDKCNYKSWKRDGITW